MPGPLKCVVSGCSNSWYNKDSDNVSFHRLLKSQNLIEQYEISSKTKLPRHKMLEFAESILRMEDASFQVNCLCGSFPQQNTVEKGKFL